MSEKKQVDTIDLTPKFAGLVEPMLDVLANREARPQAVDEIRAEFKRWARLLDAVNARDDAERLSKLDPLDRWETPLQRDDLEFEAGRLVKVRGGRPEYFSGYRLIDTVRNLANLLRVPKPVATDENIGSCDVPDGCRRGQYGLEEYDPETVIPYGNANGSLHIRFRGDYKTFCGRTCDGWSVSDQPPAQVIDSVYCCQKCKKAYLA